MNNENFQPDGKLYFKDEHPDTHGYRSIQFQKVPKIKRLPPTPPPSPSIPKDPKKCYFTILVKDGYYFLIKKDYVIHCSQTVRWMLVNSFWPEEAKELLSFPYISSYYMCLICKYFNWAYYYGVRHFRKKPAKFKISINEAKDLLKIANFLGC